MNAKLRIILQNLEFIRALLKKRLGFSLGFSYHFKELVFIQDVNSQLISFL